MAKQTHHDNDDQAKKPDHAHPKAPATPKAPVPNMSLDDDAPLPVEEVVEVEPIVEAEPISDVLMAEPIQEAKPASSVEPLVLSDDDVVEAAPAASDVFLADEVEEIVEAAPASEVLEVEPVSEVLADEVVEPLGSSAVLAEEAPVEAEPVVAVPASEPDLMSLLAEASAVTPVEEAVAEAAPISEAEPMFVDEEPVEALEDAPVEAIADEAQPAVPQFEDVAAEIAEAAPASDVQSYEDMFADEMVASADEPIASAAASEAVAAAPASEVMSAHEPISAPASEVFAAEEHVAHAPASEVVASHEPIEHAATEPQAPESGVHVAHEPDIISGSGVLADEVIEDVAEATPASVVEEVIEMPESAVLADEAIEDAVPASEVAEAMPASAVYAEEAVEDVAPASDVIFDDEIVDEIPESAVEAVELGDASSATRKSEAVLGDELDDAEAVSGTEEAEVPRSSVVFDDMPASKTTKAGKDATQNIELDQTMAFQPPSSSAKKSDDDELVTEEELVGEEVASAVDLGDVPSKKGNSSVTGIDRVAEALESGVDLGATAPPEPSIEFDEILEDLDPSDEVDLGSGEGPIISKMSKTPEKKDKKKDKAAAKETGDDIDLDDVFGEDEAEADEAEAVEEGTDELSAEEAEQYEAAEAEAAEAFDDEAAEALDGEEAEPANEFGMDDATEAEEAEEAAEAFDEEVEAAESTEDDELADFDGDDVKQTKAKGKKGKQTDDDEAAEAVEDEEEEVSAKKKGKKGKKEKEKATVGAVPAKSGFGCFTLVFAMFFVVLLMGGALAGAFFGANDQFRDLAKDQWNLDTKQPPRVPTALERGSEALAKGKYADAKTALAAAATQEEFNIRGQATWYAYVESNKGELDKEAPEAKAALVDLGQGKNKILADEIRTHDPTAKNKLNDQVATLTKEKVSVQADLKKVTSEKDEAEKKIDALADVLAKSKVIEDKTKLDNAAVLKVLQALNTDKTTLDTVNKLLKDAEIKGAGDDGVKEVIKLRNEADKNLAAVDKVLEDEKAKDKGAKGVLEIVDARNKMTKKHDDLLKTVVEAFKEFVDGKIVPEKADPQKTLIEAAKLSRQKAESPLSIPLAQLGLSLGGIGSGTSKAVEQTFDLSRVFSELGFFRTREPFIQTPEEKMDTHMALLANRKQNNAKELGAITREADWVLSEKSKADAEARNKARFVQGLALRNLEKFDDARTAFAETLKKLQPLNKAAPWSKSVWAANREITDPTFYYIPRIDAFRAEHDYKSAFDEANTAIKAMPNEASLYAERGHVRLEAVRGQKIGPDVQKEIRADAASAAKDEKVAAESAYIVGLMEEELANWPEAEKQYRQALKLHQGPFESAARYRVSLGRLLLRDPGTDVVAPMPEEKKIDDEKKVEPKKVDPKDEKKIDKKDDGKDKLDKKDDAKDKLDKKDDAKDKLDKKDDAKDAKIGRLDDERTILIHPWSMLTAALVVAQPEIKELDDEKTKVGIEETIKFAQEMINSKEPKIQGQGYILLGLALSKSGKRTQGLKEYAKGLRLIDPRIETKEIEKLVNEHPAFQQPDISGTPNPVMAERHFGEGMHLFWSKEYAKAESQFKTAVKYYDRDARYQYYLGLSQLAQSSKLKRDAAYYSFEIGARLEAKSVSTNPYAARDINMSLERIQGPVRELLNSFRFKALDPEADAKAPATPQ